MAPPSWYRCYRYDHGSGTTVGACHGKAVEHEITVEDGSTMRAYVARPAAGRSVDVGLGVVVGFEMFGHTGYVRGVADRIARLGHTAIVPDFYHRFGPAIEVPADAAGRARGLALVQRLDRDGVVRDVRAALGYLSPARAAFVGLSLGGHLGYY